MVRLLPAVLVSARSSDSARFLPGRALCRVFAAARDTARALEDIMVRAVQDSRVCKLNLSSKPWAEQKKKGYRASIYCTHSFLVCPPCRSPLRAFRSCSVLADLPLDLSVEFLHSTPSCLCGQVERLGALGRGHGRQLWLLSTAACHQAVRASSRDCRVEPSPALVPRRPHTVV